MGDSRFTGEMVKTGHEPIDREKLKKIKLVHGGQGSGEHEGHEFRGNQYNDISSPKIMMKASKNFDRLVIDPGENTTDKWQEFKSTHKTDLPKELNDARTWYSGNPVSWDLNEYYRTGKITNPDADFGFLTEEKAQIMGNRLTQAIEMSNSLPKGLELYRGVREDNAKIVRSFEIGDICEDKGYQSTSMDPREAFEFTDFGSNSMTGIESKDNAVMMRYVMKGGEKAMVGSNSERELIFNRGSKWKVVSKDIQSATLPNGQVKSMKIVTVVSV